MSARTEHSEGGAGLEAELARLGRRVRRWREERHWTLQELAGRSGLATSTVHKVESAQMIPSVAVLLKLARGLGRRPAELIHDEGGAPELLHLRTAERSPMGVEGRMVMERLTGDLFDPALETWRVTVHPGFGSGSDAIRYEGEALVLVEAGEVVFRVAGQEHRLSAGDSLHFKANVPHGWHNDAAAPVRFTVTGTLPRPLRAFMQGCASAVPR